MERKSGDDLLYHHKRKFSPFAAIALPQKDLDKLTAAQRDLTSTVHTADILLTLT